MIQLKRKDLAKVIVIGDRVLLKPTTPLERTESGLYLPQGIHRKEELYTGYVVKVGPGYPLPAMNDIEEPWKQHDGEEVKYLPLQPKEGDLAVYIQKSVYEVQIQGDSYVIAPQNALLLLIREDDL